MFHNVARAVLRVHLYLGNCVESPQGTEEMSTLAFVQAGEVDGLKKVQFKLKFSGDLALNQKESPGVKCTRDRK